MSPESYSPSPEQLLILILLSNRPEGDTTVLASLMRSVDWKRLLGLATISLHPILHFALNETGMFDFIPPDVQGILKRAKSDAVIRYIRRKTELQRVLTLLNESGIEAVVLKGASLGETVYPISYLRPMRDVDLWIRETQMPRAHSLLEADGYREKRVPHLEMDERNGKEIRFAKFFQYDLSVIEIHSTLDVHLPTEITETDAIWNRCIQHPCLCAKTLYPRDMLYHLCTHLALRHRFEQGLLWLLDISLFLSKYGSQLEWDELAEDCRRQHTSKYVFIGLQMVADLLGCAMAETAFDDLESPDDVRTVKSLAWQQIWYSDFTALPPRRFLKLMTAGSPEKMLDLIARRLHKYSTANSPDDRRPAGLLQRVRSALSWVEDDIRKARLAFRGGGFSRVNLKRACEMEVRRTEFEKRMHA